jgi:hypothetical protein
VLASYYSAADLAFVGGSLVPLGGHNPLEPAACGVPVIMGPHHATQRDAVQALRSRGALVVESTDRGVTEALEGWLPTNRLVESPAAQHWRSPRLARHRQRAAGIWPRGGLARRRFRGLAMTALMPGRPTAWPGTCAGDGTRRASRRRGASVHASSASAI